jgi:hypothetical protein
VSSTTWALPTVSVANWEEEAALQSSLERILAAPTPDDLWAL